MEGTSQAQHRARPNAAELARGFQMPNPLPASPPFAAGVKLSAAERVVSTDGRDIAITGVWQIDCLTRDLLVPANFQGLSR